MCVRFGCYALYCWPAPLLFDTDIQNELLINVVYSRALNDLQRHEANTYSIHLVNVDGFDYNYYRLKVSFEHIKPQANYIKLPSNAKKKKTNNYQLTPLHKSTHIPNECRRNNIENELNLILVDLSNRIQYLHIFFNDTCTTYLTLCFWANVFYYQKNGTGEQFVDFGWDLLFFFLENCEKLNTLNIDIQ